MNEPDNISRHEFSQFEKRMLDRFKAVDDAVELALAAKKDNTALIVAAIGILLGLASFWRH